MPSARTQREHATIAATRLERTSGRRVIASGPAVRPASYASRSASSRLRIRAVAAASGGCPVRSAPSVSQRRARDADSARHAAHSARCRSTFGEVLASADPRSSVVAPVRPSISRSLAVSHCMARSPITQGKCRAAGRSRGACASFTVPTSTPSSSAIASYFMPR